jgi:DNA-binding transcriptional LysR family regulator
LRDFHRAHPATELDVVTLFDADAAIDAVRSGVIDASFRAVTVAPHQLPDGIEVARVYDEPLQLLTGPAHEFGARAVTPAELASLRIWMPGIVTGTEWAAYYKELAAAFGLTIDTVGPDFGTEPLLDVIADSSAVATFVGEQTRLLWPADYGLRRIALCDPTPVYPHSLIWRGDNPHPALTGLCDYLGSAPLDAGQSPPPSAPEPSLSPQPPGRPSHGAGSRAPPYTSRLDRAATKASGWTTWSALSVHKCA